MSYAVVIDDANLPAILTSQPMTDEEFSAFCAEHSDLTFEMTADGDLIVIPPTHADIGVINLDIAAQFGTCARQDGRGFGSDSSTGFVLPNGARRSPDVSWTLKTRLKELPRKRKALWHLCPDVVIEIRSNSDRLNQLNEKMRE